MAINTKILNKDKCLVLVGNFSHPSSPFRYKEGSIIWTNQAGKKASVGVTIDLMDGANVMRLQYSVTDRHSGSKRDYDYAVRLEEVPSNLGTRVRYYFICPSTGKRCMKLYQSPGEDRFAHRSAWEGLNYGLQNQSRQWRDVARYFSELRKQEDISTKYLKPHYRGNPTPRYKALMKRSKKVQALGSQALHLLR